MDSRGQILGRYKLERIARGIYLYFPEPNDPLRFVRPNGETIIVDQMLGTTDLGSIPRLFWSVPGFAPNDIARPSIIHDHLYLQNHAGLSLYDFEEANEILFEAIVAEGYPARWKAAAMRWGCDQFGRSHWDKLSPEVPFDCHFVAPDAVHQLVRHRPWRVVA